jgi:hypothetical protein
VLRSVSWSLAERRGANLRSIDRQRIPWQCRIHSSTPSAGSCRSIARQSSCSSVSGHRGPHQILPLVWSFIGEMVQALDRRASQAGPENPERASTHNHALVTTYDGAGNINKLFGTQERHHRSHSKASMNWVRLFWNGQAGCRRGSHVVSPSI